MQSFVLVCKTSDVPENGMKIVNMDSIELVVVNKDSKYYCLYNKCPHMGGSLGDGSVDSEGYLTCPLHNWQFDLQTGKGPAGYEDSVPRFDIEVQNGLPRNHPQ